VLNKPYLAVDAAGIVWATDPESHRVLGYDTSGNIIAVFGQHGSTLNGMIMPTGLAVGPGGQLFVSDSENQRVLIFESPGPAQDSLEGQG
jgi:DNA-binding beta-propeller fold protein YncE